MKENRLGLRFMIGEPVEKESIVTDFSDLWVNIDPMDGLGAIKKYQDCIKQMLENRIVELEDKISCFTKADFMNKEQKNYIITMINGEIRANKRYLRSLK